MRRLVRNSLNAATMVSLILALAVAALWVRSEIIVQDELIWNNRAPAERRTSGVMIRSRLGEMSVGWGEQVFVTRAYFDMENPPEPSSRPTAPHTLPTQPGLHYVVRRFPRPTPQPAGTFWQRRGFRFVRDGPTPSPRGTVPSTETSVDVRVPHWLLLLAFAALPGVRVTRRSRATRRGNSGLCASCGYDLRATPGRCPECGMMQP
jgi:hypothetical protein